MEPVLEMFKSSCCGVRHDCLGIVQGTMCVFIPAATLREMLRQPTENGKKTNLEPLKSMGLGVDIVVHDHSFGTAEVHRDWDDVWEGIEGYMHFIVGGRLVPDGVEEKGPGELRAKGIYGGREVVLGPGDQLIIPAGEPHQNMCLNDVAKAGIVKRLRKSLLDELARLKAEDETLRQRVQQQCEPPSEDVPF